MESINSNNIKESFKKYSQDKGFKYYNSESLMAPDNSRLLFNISGGVKYQDELLGIKSCSDDKASSVQKCLRTDGIKSIGYSGRHHLFFEMLGHFMFYCANEKECKEEFIKFAYDYLIKEVGLNKKRIYTTVHPRDSVTLQVWKNLGNKNIILNDENTFVSPYANKSALRTEIKWEKDDKSLMELWNLVFTQFDSKNTFENLSDLISADSGASLERITSAYENKNNNYENTMWIDYVKYLQFSGKIENVEIYRRIADFSNASIMMINEGLRPGNKVQSYVLRRMMRMMFEMCDDASIDIEAMIIEYLKHNHLTISKEELLNTIYDELYKYYSAIENGIKQAKKMIKKYGKENIDFANLKSTCGLSEKYINLLLSDQPIILKRELR